jgi:DNA-binding phage protein
MGSLSQSGVAVKLEDAAEDQFVVEILDDSSAQSSSEPAPKMTIHQKLKRIEQVMGLPKKNQVSREKLYRRIQLNGEELGVVFERGTSFPDRVCLMEETLGLSDD